MLFYYGKKYQGRPYMLRLGYAYPEVESEIIINVDGSVVDDPHFYSEAGPIIRLWHTA